MSLAAWAWPWSLCLVVSAGWAWPARSRPLAVAALALALAWAWAPQNLLCAVLALLALGAAWQADRRYALEALLLPLALGTLLRVRAAWMPALPEKMVFWAGLLALVAACLAGQGVIASESAQGRLRALLAGQAAWGFFGLVTGSPLAPLAWTGLLSLLWQQPLLRLPLGRALEQDAPPPWSTALMFLGLGGCLGLSGFSAYFQLFVPLMGQGEGVGTMQAKLFSGAGLLAAVAMLAVLVQTCAFGYFYWLQVLPKSAEDRVRGDRIAPVLPWAALAVSLYWAFHSQAVSGVALRALQAIGAIFIEGNHAQPFL